MMDDLPTTEKMHYERTEEAKKEGNLQSDDNNII